MKKFFQIIGILIFIGLLVLIVKVFPFMKFMNQFEIVEVDQNLTLALGGGGNSAILVGDKDVLVIDSKIMGGKSKLYELVKEKARDKNIILINTHFHSDHAGGNSLYKGNTIIAGAYTKEQWIEENGEEGFPTDFLKDKKEIQIGEETVIIQNMGQAHTYNDVVVYFKNRKMLFMGDLLIIGMHPFLKENNGSKISLYLEKENKAIEEFQPDKIVPGHGPVGGKELVTQFQTYFADTKAVAEGKTELGAIQDKYKDNISFLSMASTEATVNYWKKELGIK